MKFFFDVVDRMAKFPNTLGVSAANALINDDASLSAAPVLKAVVRDLKRYMQLKHDTTRQRILSVGYDAATRHTRDRMVLDYLTSGDKDTSLDHWTVSITS